MKSKTLLFILIFLVVVLTSVGSFADDKEKFGFYVPKQNEEIYGIWVNKDYTTVQFRYPQKIEILFWGYWEEYDKVTDDTSIIQGTITLVDRWIDSDGNICYKTYWMFGESKYDDFYLYKISKDRSTMESIYNSYKWPIEADMNKDSPNYRMYYRQKKILKYPASVLQFVMFISVNGRFVK
jgi:hypothetical protein